MSDLHVANDGTVFQLTPLTEAGNNWVVDHLPEDRIWGHHAILVEHRYIADIVDGAIADGLDVENV